MLNYLWSALVLISIVCSFPTGNSAQLSAAIIDSCSQAIELLTAMAGIILLWSGIMKIAQESGLTTSFAKLLFPVLRLLFPGLKEEPKVLGSISMNLTANLLGLGNTATPLGIQAMKELDELNGGRDTASDEMVVFVVMNTASLQLMPTMLGSLRQQYGSAAPFEILVPVWISSACALSVALMIAYGGNRSQLKKRGRKWK